MVARSTQEEQKSRRRKRLLKGLLVGGAAVGVPALANLLIARKSRRLSEPAWGRLKRYASPLGEIAFQHLGTGKPLLLLHSLGPGHDSEEWRQAAEILARHHQVFVPDLLGWGRSEKPRRPYDAETYIRLLTGFMEDVLQEPAAIVAAGLPSAYAVQVAVDEPQMVRLLGLVSPSGLDHHCDDPDLKDALLYRLLRAPLLGTSALNMYTSRAGLQHYLRRELLAAPERADALRLEHHYTSSHQPRSHLALAAFLSGHLNHRIDEQLSRLSAKVWLAWGRQSKAPQVESADLWLQRLPTAELDVFDNCGALPHLEEPSRFCRQLEAFLSASAD